MEKITLEYVEKVGLLAIGEEECKRVLSLLDAEKTVYYENGEGWHITLSPDGVMRIDGIEVIPMVFGIQSKDGYIDIDATYNRPLKARVKKIVFGKETKIICYRSFEDFTELCEIEIPDTLERLVSPFENCAKLRPYALPPSLTYISGDAFGIFPDEVVLPKGVTDISGFFKESSIRKITLSPGIKRIGMRDFYKCTRLEKITFAEGLEVIADEAFSYCTALTDLVFPKSLSYIGGFAFAHCDNLTKVCVTDDTEIDANAFRDTPVQKAMQARRVDTFSPIAYEGDDTSLPHFARMKEILSGKPLSEQAMLKSLKPKKSVSLAFQPYP